MTQQSALATFDPHNLAAREGLHVMDSQTWAREKERGGHMSVEIRLSGEKEEWLVRAAIGTASPFIPADAVDTLVAAGLGEQNSSGRLKVNAAGRAYIADKNLSTKIEKRRRR
jgi:hypothetical protein